MTKAKSPFLPITNDIDDSVIERIAEAKGVPTLSLRAEPERPSPTPAQERPVAGVPPANPEREGAGRQLPAAIAASPAPSVPPGAPTPRASVAYVKFGMPDYAYKELALRQVQENVTLNYLILQGLRAIGITIEDADMVKDGRRLRGSRTTA